jgi:DNA-binding NarL/FixJ family response regulator
MNDWIAVLEATYRVEADLEAWTLGILDACAPILDEGDGLIACHFRSDGKRIGIEHFSTRNTGPAPRRAVDSILGVNGTGVELSADIYRSWRFRSFSEAFGETVGEAAFRQATRGRYADGWGGMAPSGTGRAVAIGAPLRAARRASTALRDRWARAASHLGAGLRLRHALADLHTNASRVEAIVDVGGTVREARGEASCPDAREALRAAVRRIDRARTRAGRADPDQALELWRGLVAGRWSLVDRFEASGSRFIVALRNDPNVADPRGLSRRQAQVAEFLGLGYSEKEIAYTLGLSPTGVSRYAQQVCAKLRATRAEVASLFAPSGLRQRMHEVAVGEERFAIGSAPVVRDDAIGDLSQSEQLVARAACRGVASAAIAAERGTSPRTVDNQLGAIYRKLGVHSRTELAAKLSA